MSKWNARLVVVVGLLGFGGMNASFCELLVGQEVEIANQPASSAPPSAAPSSSTPPTMTFPPGHPMQGQPIPGMTPPTATPGPSDPSAKPDDSKDKPKGGDKAKAKGEDNKADPSKPVARPAEPPEKPDPKELEVKLDADGKVKLDFKGQPWPAVLEWLADISKLTLDWQEAPGGYLNLTTQQRYTVEETRDLINGLLLERGFTLLLDRDEVLKLVNLKKLNPSLVPRVTPEELADRPPHEFVKVSFTLRRLVATKTAEELSALKSPNGTLAAMETTNRIDAMDAVLNLRDIAEVIRRAEDDDDCRFGPWKRKLLYRRASLVQKQLESLLGDGSGGMPPGMTPEQMQQMQQMQAQQQMQRQMQAAQKGKAPPAAKKPADDKVRMLADDRTNTLIVYAPPDVLAMLKDAVDVIDVPREQSGAIQATVGRMKMYHLSTMDPEPLVKTLRELGNLDLDTRLEVDRKNNAIVAFANLADHVTIQMMIDKLDGTGRQAEVIPLRRLEADYVAGTIQHVLFGGRNKESKTKSSSSSSSRYYGGWYPDYGGSSRSDTSDKDAFRVDADIERNRLLLWANKVEMQEVEAFLVKLGEPIGDEQEHRTVRVLDSYSAEETQALIDRLRKSWAGKNELLIDEPTLNRPPETPPTMPEPDKQTLRPAVPPIEETVEPADEATASASRIRFAQLRNEEAVGGDSPESGSARSAAPPIKITRDPLGRLVIASEDTRALDLFEELVGKLSPTRDTFAKFRLKNAWAYDVVDNLKAFFKTQSADTDVENVWWSGWYGDPVKKNDDDDDSVRLSKRRKLTFIADSDSNSIIVKGADAEQLALIKELVEFYDDRTEKIDPRNLRKEDVIAIRHSKASVIAATLKEVYRDLLSENDKEFEANKKGENQRRSSYSSWYGSRGSDEKEPQRAPRFKGLLSIGVDELSNSLIVSAPAYLFDNVVELIDRLDEMAKPAVSSIDVIKLENGVDTGRLQETLRKILGDSDAEAARRGAPRPRPDGPMIPGQYPR